MKMSSYKTSVSQPQLLTPQFFEQPPKLLPPSVFRQATDRSKSDDHPSDREKCDSESEIAECSSFTCEKAPADVNPTDPMQAQPSNPSVKTGGSGQNAPSHSESKKIKLCSESDTFNPKCDNQLLLVAENVSYSLATKQRWKKSEHLAVGSSSKEGKVLEYATPTVGQLTLDTPTLLTSTSVPEAALSRSSDSLTVFRVNDSPSTRKVVSFPTPAFIESSDLSPDDKPLISAPHSLPVASFDGGYSCRNDFDKVRSSTSKPHTTDNLKLSRVEAPPTKLNTNSWSSKSHSEFVSPTLSKSKDSQHRFVDTGKRSISKVSVRSVEAMATAAVDTENDCMLAQLLQNEEYGSTSVVPDKYVVEQEVKRKTKKQSADCSSDFEIARRLQQELDAEIAHSMQRQEDHRQRPRSGQGRRLGTLSDDGDTAHEGVSGYYDNNNQYRYRIREDVAAQPDVSVGHRSGLGARGSSSLTRRPLPSRHLYHPGATAIVGEEMDMSYEALVQLEDVSRGLDKDVISRLSNTYQYHPSSSTDKSCSVCLCEFESGDSLRSLPCIHAFHKNCIDKWLTDNRHCPVCMKDIDSLQS